MKKWEKPLMSELGIEMTQDRNDTKEYCCECGQMVFNKGKYNSSRHLPTCSKFKETGSTYTICS